MILRLLVFLVPLCAGVALGSQAPINASLARHVGPVRAVLVSVTISLLVLLVIVSVDRGGGRLAALATAPPWSLAGGFLGAIVLIGTVVAVPRLGTAATITLLVSGQLATAAAVDHFGWLDVAQRPLDGPRLVGLVLLATGGALVVRR